MAAATTLMHNGNFLGLRRLLLLAKPAGAVTSIAAAAISFATILSLVHELAFYSVIDFSFLALLTAADYFKQSIYWVPLVVFSLISGDAAGHISNKKFLLKKAAAIAESDHNALLLLGFRFNFKILVAVTFAVLILAAFSIFFPWPIIFLPLH